ncbi:MAG: substrate-binding domain-containing protein [Methylophaga sp.]
MKFDIQRSKTFKAALSLLIGTSIMLSGSASASDKTLRVCAAADELPYSNKNSEGFENKLAEILAEEMDRDLEYVWSDKAAIFLVTEKLLKNECDVVMGVDKDDPRVATSIPYYKSGYAFIYPAGKGLDIKTWKSPDLKAMTKFAVVPGSPSEVMLRELDKYEGNFNYLMSLIGFKSRRNQYVRYKPDLLISEVASGKADIAHIWAPEAARYVKSSPVPLEMVVSEEIAETHDGEGVLQHYDQSIAVRSEDTDLLAEINTALEKADSKIKAVLKQEGVPLL